MSDFPAFDKIPRLNRTYVISEKIDGTNGLIEVRPYDEDSPYTDETPGVSVVGIAKEGKEADHRTDLVTVRAGSRNRWLTSAADNFGFAKWVESHAAELAWLGPGLHYGEWYGKGIQRGYGLNEKRFMLFNTDRWRDPEKRPECCEVATVLAVGERVLTVDVYYATEGLRIGGSRHVPGFTNPEGMVIYHTAARQYFKVLLENDMSPKGNAA